MPRISKSKDEEADLVDGVVDVRRDGGEGGAGVDGHQDMKLEGPASALEEVSIRMSDITTTQSLIRVSPILKLQH